jgi:hypothetical protein
MTEGPGKANQVAMRPADPSPPLGAPAQVVVARTTIYEIANENGSNSATIG